MISLLDVNVLIALVDRDHPHHAAAARFFAETRSAGWATCPLVENGFIRILGHPNYRNGPGSAAGARDHLREFIAMPGHQFWPDDVSLSDARLFPTLPRAKALTDLYLLALAVKRGGRFATFDAGIDATLVPGGPAAYALIATD